jgi:hypothetical protein
VSNEGRICWLASVSLFIAGCIVALLVPRFWQKGGTFATAVEQPTSKSLWTFEADFRPPRSITVNSPDKTEILVFQVERPKPIPGLIHVLGSYPISIKNLSDRAYAVSYIIYAYDAQNHRLDETMDSVTLGATEIVRRQLEFSHQLSANARTSATFRLIADIDH